MSSDPNPNADLRESYYCPNNRDAGCECPEGTDRDVGGECGTECDCPCHRCDCACHEDFEYTYDDLARPHDDRSCAEYQRWLDQPVHARLSSLENVTFRHDVPTGLTRREWLDLSESEETDVLGELVHQHVEVAVLDDPRDV